MKTRILIAALHFNENSSNDQAVNKDREARWCIAYPRAKKGAMCVAKPVVNGPTYNYVDFLLMAIIERRENFPSYRMARDDFLRITACDPGFLTDDFLKVDKRELIDSRTSRYKPNYKD